LQVDVRGGAIAAVRQTDAATAAGQAWSDARGLPVAFGDLPLEEAVALAHAFAHGAWRPLGRVDALGAEPQLVLESALKLAPDLEPGGAGTPAPAGADTAGATGTRAWAYVDAATAALRSVRVLDAADFVVRTYEDLMWASAVSPRRLASFRVTSNAHASHTLFRCDVP
jgi:hypothetical protein